MYDVFLRFPDYKTKAVTFSYDDGVEQDEKLIHIFNWRTRVLVRPRRGGLSERAVRERSAGGRGKVRGHGIRAERGHRRHHAAELTSCREGVRT